MSYTVKKSSDRTLREISQFGVRSSNIAPKAVESEHIGEQAVQTQHVQDKAITGVKIAEASIDEAHIKEAAITSAKIGDLSADKIKAGTLTVTDEEGSGAARIVVKSGANEKIRLDKDGIVVNNGDIVVKSPSGATMISGEGINVNEFTQNVMRGLNVVRNPFFVDRFSGERNIELAMLPGDPGAQMPPMSYYAIAALGDDIYFFGGHDRTGYYTNNCWRYDTKANVWEQKGNMPIPGGNFSAVTINNRIYTFGGVSGFNDCREYNPATDTWQKKVSGATARYGHAAVAVNDKMYVFGGTSSGQYLSDCWEYSPVTNSWTQKASAPQVMERPKATVVDGVVYICTGYHMMSYEPQSDAWTELSAPPMSSGRLFSVDGKVFWMWYENPYEYDIENDTWKEVNFGMTVGHQFQAVDLGDRSYLFTDSIFQDSTKVYVAYAEAGRDSNGFFASAWHLKDDNTAKTYFEDSNVKGAGQVRFNATSYQQSIHLVQYLDTRNNSYPEPYVATIYYSANDDNAVFEVKVGGIVYSKQLLWDDDKQEIYLPEGLGTNGVSISVKAQGATQLTVYGVQIEKGKISTGIVSPHINDIGIPNGSIRPEHFSPSAGIPPGAVMAFAMQAPPIGWLACDGSAVSRTQYKNLFDAIGTTFGAGDGSTTFNLPDLRGEFIRGWDNNRGVDPGRQFGSWQEDALQNITGSITVKPTSSIQFLTDGGQSSIITEGALGITSYSNKMSIDNGPTTTLYPDGIFFDASRSARTASETRPRNVALLYCIKY